MGNWRNRQPRRFFYNQPKSRASAYYPQIESPPRSAFVEDGVPSWEKKFCYFIGSVPWRKIVDAKKFMYCHGNVINWDDSAAEEAFQNAKNRFWAEMNGLPCDISWPDPDAYIDEINWNTDVDPELIKDLERELFVPDDGVKDSKVGRKKKKSWNVLPIPSDGYNGNPGDVDNLWECNNNIQNCASFKDKAQRWDECGPILNNSFKLNGEDNSWERSFPQGSEPVNDNTWEDWNNKSGRCNPGGNLVNNLEDCDKSCNPWECNKNMQNSITLKDKAQSWNQWDTGLNNSSKLKNDDNSWGHSSPEGNEAVKSNAWEDCGNKLWGCNHDGSHVNQLIDWDKSSNPWERSCQGVSTEKDKGWGNFGESSWGYNQEESRKWNNGGDSWESRVVRDGRTPEDRGWRHSGGNSWGWKQWDDNYSKEPKTMEFRKSSGSWGTLNEGFRKREGTHPYITGYQSTRFRGDNHRAGHTWREGKAKRVSFA